MHSASPAPYHPAKHRRAYPACLRILSPLPPCTAPPIATRSAAPSLRCCTHTLLPFLTRLNNLFHYRCLQPRGGDTHLPYLYAFSLFSLCRTRRAAWRHAPPHLSAHRIWTGRASRRFGSCTSAATLDSVTAMRAYLPTAAWYLPTTFDGAATFCAAKRACSLPRAHGHPSPLPPPDYLPLAFRLLPTDGFLAAVQF